MKKLLAIVLSVMMVLTVGIPAMAEEAELTPGVFVNEDESSVTGYSVTFVFESADAQTVELDMGANFYEQGQTWGVVPEEAISPFDYHDGLIAVGYEGCSIPLEKAEGTDLWTVTVPLPSGLYQYNYVVDGEPADDPTNPWMKNPNENGGQDGDCTVYVPYDAEKQPNAVDFSYLDASTVTEAGELNYVTYTDVNGNVANLGVYTPYGYDAEREEPYKVLYVSHGSGANECNWFGCGALNTEFDHLIEDGLVEPCVVVTMNNQVYEWDFPVILDNLMNNILPFMEENYNVSSDPSGRGFCGLSAGGGTTAYVMMNATEDFDYYGVYAGNTLLKVDYSNFQYEGEQPVIMVGSACYDKAYLSGARFALSLHQQGAEFGWEEVLGGHDWFTWPHLMKIFATEYLWK